MNQTSKDDANGFNDLIKEALLSSARLRHCAATDCPCGQGKKAMARLPSWVETVTDEATARAYIEGIAAIGSLLDSLTALIPDGPREFSALLISEAAHIGGLLAEVQIQEAIDAQSVREAEAEEKTPKTVNSPKPIPNALAFVSGPKFPREN